MNESFYPRALCHFKEAQRALSIEPVEVLRRTASHSCEMNDCINARHVIRLGVKYVHDSLTGIKIRSGTPNRSNDLMSTSGGRIHELAA